MGTVYLLHFDKPFKHARHYIGFTTNLESRLEHHKHGTGARLLAVVGTAGIGWTVARTWTGTRGLERKIKGYGARSRFCPTCQGKGGEAV